LVTNKHNCEHNSNKKHGREIVSFFFAAADGIGDNRGRYIHLRLYTAASLSLLLLLKAYHDLE
jgi:hypothetical protein